MRSGERNTWAVATAAAAVLLIGVPRSVDLFRAESARHVVGAILGLAFFAWLTWRLYVQMSDGWEQGPRFHYVSAAGYAAFVVLALALVGWDVAQDDFRPRVLVSLVVMALFVVSSIWSARLKAKARPPQQRSSTQA